MGGATMQFVTAKEPHTARGGEIGDFWLRREATLALSMSERLARVHALCKQMSAVKGTAQARCAPKASASCPTLAPRT